MKYIQTYDNFKPIKINSAKPFKVKKNLDKSIKYLQNGIKSLRRRLDDPKNRKVANHTKMNNDKNFKIQKLKDLQFKKLKQQEYLKNNPIKESKEENLLNVLASENFQPEHILNYIGDLKEGVDYDIEMDYNWNKQEYIPKYDKNGIKMLFNSKKLEDLMNIEVGVISELIKFLSPYYSFDYYVDDDELDYLHVHLTPELEEKFKQLSIKFGYPINPIKKGKIHKLFNYLSLEKELKDFKLEIAAEHESAIKDSAKNILKSLPFKIDAKYNKFDLELTFDYDSMIKYMEENNLNVKSLKEFIENVSANDFSYDFLTEHFDELGDFEDLKKVMKNAVENYLENPDEIFPFLIEKDNLTVFKNKIEFAYFDYYYNYEYHDKKMNLFQMAINRNGEIKKWLNSKEFEKYIIKNGSNDEIENFNQFRFGETVKNFNL